MKYFYLRKVFLILLCVSFLGCDSMLVTLAGELTGSLLQKTISKNTKQKVLFKDPNLIGRQLVVKKEIEIKQENTLGFEETCLDKPNSSSKFKNILSAGSKLKIVEIIFMNRDEKDFLFYYVEVVESLEKKFIGTKYNCLLLMNFYPKEMEFFKKYQKNYLEFIPIEKPNDVQLSTSNTISPQ